MIGFTEILFTLVIAIGVLIALGYAILRAWRYIRDEKRRHRLLREEDERNHRKLMASDYAEIMGMSTGVPLSFEDYSKPSQKVKKIT